MLTENKPSKITIHDRSLLTRALQGAGIATLLLIIFLLIRGDFSPGQKTWLILPFITVPLGGALGGVLYYLLDMLRFQGGWKKGVADLLTLVTYLLLLVATLIAGLHGRD